MGWVTRRLRAGKAVNHFAIKNYNKQLVLLMILGQAEDIGDLRNSGSL